MIISSSAIILSKIRYGDNDLIIKCLTNNYGIMSFLVRNVSISKKSKNKFAYFQLLSVLELEIDYKLNRSLQYIKEIKIKYNFNSLHTNIVKSSVIMFISEILSSILNQESEDIELYNFIENSIIWYDKENSNTSFYLIFLMRITHYLGFYPEPINDTFNFFDLKEGIYKKYKTNEYCITEENLSLFKSILGIKFDKSVLPVFNKQEKMLILNSILKYYKLHIDGFKEPKSLAVLNQIFSEHPHME